MSGNKDMLIRTRVHSIRNYMELEFRPVTEVITEEELEEEADCEIRKELLSRKRYITPETAEKGDIAELRLSSDVTGFNKDSIKINLGLGLFSREIEDSVAGHRAGDTYRLTAGAGDVTVTVLSLSRRCDAVFDDDMVKSLGIEGVGTTDEYRSYLDRRNMEFFREAYVEYYAMDLFDVMMEESDIDYCEEDILFFADQFEEGASEARGGSRDAAGDEESDDEFDYEEASFLLRLYIADCIGRGVDYRTNRNIPYGSGPLTEMRDRVLAPIKAYLDNKVKVTIMEDNNGNI